MSTIPLPQARYELLKDEATAQFLVKKKVCILSTVVLLSIAVTGVVLLLINLLYFTNGFELPLNYESKEFPSQWIERAIKYNSFNKSNPKFEDSANKIRKNYRYNEIDNYKLVCYYSIPSSNSDDHYLSIDKIDPNLCTHINIGFLSILNNVINITPTENKTLIDMVSLKKQNKNLKVLMSIGGADNNTEFPSMVYNHTSRKEFIKSIVTTLKKYKLDGVDLDWEFPNEHKNGDKRQRMHFTQLLREIREEIHRHSQKHKFILSVAVAAPSTLADMSYDISYMNKFVDYINLMSYDYHFYTQYTPFTGLNSPLYHRSNEHGYFMTLNINYSAYHWHDYGMDKSKIIIGLPTYGHSFQLVNQRNNGLMAPACGYGKTGHIGFIDYADVCWFLNYNQIKAVFDMEAKSPYAYKGTEWISFDDSQSLTYKTEYIKSNNFGGAMILSLNTDDHKGTCTKTYNAKMETFPLTRKVKSVLYDDQL